MSKYPFKQTHSVVFLQFLVFLLLLVSTTPVAAQLRIIPKPQKMEMQDGSFTLNGLTVIVAKSNELKDAGQYLAGLLYPATGLKIRVRSAARKGNPGIHLKLDSSRTDLGEEGYLLNCTPGEIIITGAKPAGVFYGIQSLRQLLPVEIESRRRVSNIKWSIPAVNIEDKPRFKWRGYLLDVARHYRTKDEILRYIDLLAFQKLNTLHLHLVDDQGWRLEIKKYPKLIEVGARVRDYSGKTGENWFYSQQDIREIVAYAAARFINVVPEIEMPGHSAAITTSYPELGCDGKSSTELCVTQEQTFNFMTDVLDEVISLFPGSFIHVGADEVRPERWRACSRCSKKMEELGNTNLPEDVKTVRVKVSTGAGRPYHEDIGRLQGEYIRRIDDYLVSKGRRMIGWDEILEGGLKKSSHAVVQAWRSGEVVSAAAAQGREVLVSVYPDYYLDINSVSLLQTYNYEPVPENLPGDQEKFVIGVQGNMWGEVLKSPELVDIYSFPRIIAIAEIGWTERKAQDFSDFSAGLETMRKRLELIGVKYQH